MLQSPGQGKGRRLLPNHSHLGKGKGRGYSRITVTWARDQEEVTTESQSVGPPRPPYKAPLLDWFQQEPGIESPIEVLP
jgi:hypothetical protein